MRKFSIFTPFILCNAVLVFLLINPWLTNWHGQAISIMAIEIVLLFLIGIPITLYQMIRLKKKLRQSLSDSLDTVLDFLSGVT